MSSITVFYSDLMLSNPRSASPSGLKPKLIVEHLTKHNIPMNIVVPEPATIEMFAQVHDQKFVEEMLSGRRDNGFGTRSMDVARSLPWTSGGLVSAALFSLKTGKPSLAPVSGMHHSGYDYCWGFCSLDGAALASVEAHKVTGGSIGFFDGDAHAPDGVINIKETLGLDWLEVYSPIHDFGTAALAKSFLASLPDILERRFAKSRLLIFQAAADVLDIDPLHAGWLTEREVAQRDLVVFQTMKRLGIPVCILAGGGYSRDENGTIEPVLRVHLNTVLACLRVEAEASNEAKRGEVDVKGL